MTDTMRAPPRETIRRPPPETPRRGLGPAVGILAIVVIALGAWIIYDFLQGPTLAPAAEVGQLVDDYTAAWNEYDSEAFLETTRQGYTFTSSAAGTFDRDEQALIIETTLSANAWQVRMLEDPIVVGDGPWYHVSFPVEIESLLRGTRQGLSVLTVYETLDGDLLVTDHVYTGR